MDKAERSYVPQPGGGTEGDGEGYYYYKNRGRFCQAKKGAQTEFNRGFWPENAAGSKTGLDKGRVMGYKERERSVQGDSRPAKGRPGAAMACTG